MTYMRQDVECVSCPICGNDDTALFIRGRGQRQIVRCKRDGLVFVTPRQSRDRIRVAVEEFVREDNQHLFNVARDATLRRGAPAGLGTKGGGNLLDVGCATGRFFSNFPPSWRLFGVDPCQQAVEYARRHYNLEVRCGSLEEACWPEQFFDVVTILDALYYFPDPVRDLTEARRIRKPGGVLAVEIPGFT